MSFFTGPMRKHVNGHKDLTDHKDILNVQAGSKVLIPLINMGSTTVDVLVKEGDHVKVGTKVAIRNDHFKVPMFSSVSGTVKGIEKCMHSSLRPVDHLAIENDGLYEEEAPLTPIDPTTATVDELVDFMLNAGIVGCGGAGFPTYVKYKGVKGIKTLLINGVECEPFITADYKNMEANLKELACGVATLKKMCGAEKAYVCIKETKKELLPKVEEALKGLEGVELRPVPDVYPMGWERTVVYEVTGQRYDRLPSEIGVVVNNATTAIAFAHAMLTGMPIVNKIVTVSGDAVANPVNVCVPVGVSAAEVIAACGGYTSEDVLLLAGGPMMGRSITNDKFVVTPYTNALTVLDNKPVREVGCLRCGRCVDHCPAGLMPVRINAAEKAKDVEKLTALSVMDCIECGMCTYICPSKIKVTEGVRRAKRIIQMQAKK